MSRQVFQCPQIQPAQRWLCPRIPLPGSWRHSTRKSRRRHAHAAVEGWDSSTCWPSASQAPPIFAAQAARMVADRVRAPARRVECAKSSQGRVGSDLRPTLVPIALKTDRATSLGRWDDSRPKHASPPGPRIEARRDLPETSTNASPMAPGIRPQIDPGPRACGGTAVNQKRCRPPQLCRGRTAGRLSTRGALRWYPPEPKASRTRMWG